MGFPDESAFNLNAVAGVTVRELVARCDLGTSASEGDEGVQQSFEVREVALLSDGREVVLLDDRGWSGRVNAGSYWATESRSGIEADVLNVVLSDDAEDTGHAHEWAVFVSRLAEAGVAVTSDELRRTPYRVVLSDRILERLRDGE